MIYRKSLVCSHVVIRRYNIAPSIPLLVEEIFADGRTPMSYLNSYQFKYTIGSPIYLPIYPCFIALKKEAICFGGIELSWRTRTYKASPISIMYSGYQAQNGWLKYRGTGRMSRNRNGRPTKSFNEDWYSTLTRLWGKKNWSV